MCADRQARQVEITMEKTICLFGGPLFDGERLFERGAVVFNGHGILSVEPGDRERDADRAVDVGGKLIAPGFVDVHSDALEKCIEIRPGVYFDADFALLNLDKRLGACGITTFCHAISFAEEEFGLRSCGEAEALVRLVHRFKKSNRAAVNHLVHARFEVNSMGREQVIARLIKEDLIDALSVMDHTPGQGQFKTLESYIAYHTSTYKVSAGQVTALVERKMAGKEESMKRVVRAAQLARYADIPFLSHDDDTEEKVSFVRELGVDASEFPVSLEAARKAKGFDMKVFMGAPNLIRNCSSNNHLRASEALEAGVCDALVSDYSPECLLQAPFTVSKRQSSDLGEAMKLVTSTPGDYLRQRTTAGRLAGDMPADVAVIDHAGPWATVAQTWVAGRRVYDSGR